MTSEENAASDPTGTSDTNNEVSGLASITSFTGTTRSPSVANASKPPSGSRYEVLFTPKRIDSEEDIIPPNIDDFYYKHLVNARLSRAGVQITQVNAESHVNFDPTRTSAKNSTALFITESPSHIPAPLKITMSAVDETVRPGDRRGSTRRIRWGSHQDFRIFTDSKTDDIRRSLSMLQMDPAMQGKCHIPPQIRVHIAQQLLQIRDLIVEIVTYFRSIGYGGKDFRWSPHSLQEYGITNPPKFKIPQAFQNFAVTDTKS